MSAGMRMLTRVGLAKALMTLGERLDAIVEDVHVSVLVFPKTLHKLPQDGLAVRHQVRFGFFLQAGKGRRRGLLHLLIVVQHSTEDAVHHGSCTFCAGSSRCDAHSEYRPRHGDLVVEPVSGGRIRSLVKTSNAAAEHFRNIPTSIRPRDHRPTSKSSDSSSTSPRYLVPIVGGIIIGRGPVGCWWPRRTRAGRLGVLRLFRSSARSSLSVSSRASSSFSAVARG